MRQRYRSALYAICLGFTVTGSGCQPGAEGEPAVFPSGAKGDGREPVSRFTAPLDQDAWVTRTLAGAFAANPTALPREQTRVRVQLQHVEGMTYNAVISNLGDQPLVFARNKSAYVAYARETGEGGRTWYSRLATDPCPGEDAAVCATAFDTVPPSYGGEVQPHQQHVIEGIDLSKFYIEGLQGTAAPAGWTAIALDGHYSGFSPSDDRYRLVFQFATLCPPQTYDASPYVGSLDPSLTFCGIGNAFSRTYEFTAD